MYKKKRTYISLQSLIKKRHVRNVRSYERLQNNVRGSHGNPKGDEQMVYHTQKSFVPIYTFTTVFLSRFHVLFLIIILTTYTYFFIYIAIQRVVFLWCRIWLLAMGRELEYPLYMFLSPTWRDYRPRSEISWTSKIYYPKKTLKYKSISCTFHAKKIIWKSCYVGVYTCTS